MMDDRDNPKICYVKGFLMGTVGSPNDYSKEELLARMRYCVAVLEGEDNPARHLKDSSIIPLTQKPLESENQGAVTGLGSSDKATGDSSDEAASSGGAE